MSFIRLILIGFSLGSGTIAVWSLVKELSKSSVAATNAAIVLIAILVAITAVALPNEKKE